MKKVWLLMADHFDALKPRERVAVFMALAAVLVGVFFFFAFNPAYARYQQARSYVQLSEQGLAAVSAEELALLQQASLDPDAEIRQTTSSLVNENARLRASLVSAQAHLASPAKMTEMLRDLIAGQKGLELVSLRSVPAEDVLASVDAGEKLPVLNAPKSQSLFRHGIELTVRGDYQTLAAYVRKVENLPWKIRLGQMNLKSGVYPQAMLSLNLYTLSLERAWLSF